MITAPDAKTVEFDFCNPDVAFLSQIAFQALAIDDAGYLIANMGTTSGTGAILNTPNGTGPYKFVSWDKGTRMDFAANPTYWGTKALTPNLELQWSDQSAARLVRSRPAPSTASTTRARTTSPPSRPTRPSSSTRARASTPSTWA